MNGSFEYWRFTGVFMVSRTGLVVGDGWWTTVIAAVDVCLWKKKFQILKTCDHSRWREKQLPEYHQVLLLVSKWSVDYLDLKHWGDIVDLSVIAWQVDLLLNLVVISMVSKVVDEHWLHPYVEIVDYLVKTALFVVNLNLRKFSIEPIDLSSWQTKISICLISIMNSRSLLWRSWIIDWILCNVSVSFRIVSSCCIVRLNNICKIVPFIRIEIWKWLNTNKKGESKKLKWNMNWFVSSSFFDIGFYCFGSIRSHWPSNRLWIRRILVIDPNHIIFSSSIR